MNVPTKIELVKADITTLCIDAIVNAANTTLLGGGGVDGAIHRVAGPQLLKECRALDGCRTGEAKITAGYNLSARYVIHTVGPVWHGGTSNERALLTSCYLHSLLLAKEHKLKSIAFPSISTGAYRFPIEEAAAIAVDAVKAFIEENPAFFEKVLFVVFSDKDFEAYRSVLKGRGVLHTEA